MSFIKTMLFTLLFLNINSLYSQDINAHIWKNRLLLILTNNTNNTVYKKQIKELQSDINDLEERKLFVYQIKKNSYKLGLKKSVIWKNSTELYKAYKKTNTAFEILLIGLDGTIKLRQSTFLNSKNLFSIIDGMPMRNGLANKFGTIF